MRHLASKLLAVLVSFSLIAFPIAPAYGQAPQTAGHVTAQIPDAQIARPMGNISAEPGTTVLWDDLVQTQPRGRVRVTLDDGSILNVGSNSSLRVRQHNAQTRETDLTLTFGTMRARVTKLGAGQRFEVRTNTAVLGVIGTDFFLLATATQTKVIVYQGIVFMHNINAAILGTTQVFAGKEAVINAGQPPSPASPSTPSEVQDSVNETNVGEELPPPQPPPQPPPVAGAPWALIGAIVAFAVVAIVIPATGGIDRHPNPPPPPPRRCGRRCD